MRDLFAFGCVAIMRSFFIALTILVFVGCGGPATVLTGVVTLDGNPVPDATVEFFPVSGLGKASFTKTDSAGRYRASVAPSTMAVVITATKVDGKVKNPIGNGEMVDRLVSAVPERYGRQDKTPLMVDPVAGTVTTIDLSLESSAPTRTQRGQ